MVDVSIQRCFVVECHWRHWATPTIHRISPFIPLDQLLRAYDYFLALVFIIIADIHRLAVNLFHLLILLGTNLLYQFLL